MNTADVYDVLTAVAAGTGRQIGEVDVQLWQAVLGDCPKQFALDTVLAHFREQPGVWLEPGHVFARWRDYRRDQIAREDEQLRAARQAALDARLAGVDELAEAKSLKALDVPLKFTRPSQGQQINALTVACPWCKATPGQACRVPDSRQVLTRTSAHPARVEAATEKHNHQEETPA